MKQNVYVCNSVYQDGGLSEMDYKDNSIDFIGRMCISSVGELLKSASIPEADVPVFWGSGLGCVKSQHEFNSVFEESGALAVNPRYFPNAVLNAPSSRVSIHFDIKSPVYNISGGIDSGIKALKLACSYIENAEMENAIVCYAEEKSYFSEKIWTEKKSSFCGAIYLSVKETVKSIDEIWGEISEIEDSEEAFRRIANSFMK